VEVVVAAVVAVVGDGGTPVVELRMLVGWVVEVGDGVGIVDWIERISCGDVVVGKPETEAVAAGWLKRRRMVMGWVVVGL